jgi:hypothetical protein
MSRLSKITTGTPPQTKKVTQSSATSKRPAPSDPRPSTDLETGLSHLEKTGSARHHARQIIKATLVGGVTFSLLITGKKIFTGSQTPTTAKAVALRAPSSDYALAPLTLSSGRQLLSLPTIYDAYAINTFTTDSQLHPASSPLPDNQRVTAWDGYGVSDDQGIWLQKTEADGTLIGSPIRVNSDTADTQSEPTIATTTTGKILVAWKDGEKFRAKIFDSQLNVIKNEHTIKPPNQTKYISIKALRTTNNQLLLGTTSAFKTYIGGEGYYGNSGHYEHSYSIDIYTYDETLNIHHSSVFTSNLSRGSSSSAEKIKTVSLSNEKTILSWQRYWAGWWQLEGIVVDSNGNTLTNVFSITNASSEQHQHTMASFMDGTAVIAWRDPSSNILKARAYDSTGNAVSMEKQISVFSATAQNPSLTTTPDNALLLTWQEPTAGGSLVYGQYLTQDLEEIGSTFPLNFQEQDQQSRPSVIFSTPGNIALATWEGTDASGSGIFGARVPQNTLSIATTYDTFNYIEDVPYKFDPMAIYSTESSTATFTLTLTNPGSGTLNTETIGSTTPTYNPATGVWDAEGPIENLNQLLAGLTFTPTSDSHTSTSILININDGHNQASKTITLVGNPVPDAPVVDHPIQPQTAKVDQNFTLSIPPHTFLSPDQKSLTYTVTLGNGTPLDTTCFSFDPDTQTISGVPGYKDQGEITLTVTANDGTYATSNTFPLYISANLNTQGFNQPKTYIEDTPYTFSDLNIGSASSANAILTLTLSDATAGALSTDTKGSTTSAYDPDTGVWQAPGKITEINALLAKLSFIPALNSYKDFAITAQVSDNVNPDLETTFTMLGTSVNDDITVKNPPTAKTFKTGAPFSIPLSEDIFEDIDPDADITVAVTSLDTLLLPDVISFDPDTKTISGQIDTKRSIILKITGSDGQGSNAVTHQVINFEADLSLSPDQETITFQEETPLTLNPFSIESENSSTATISLTLSNPAAGILSTPSSGPTTATYNAETGLWQAQGFITDLNTILESIEFTPAENFADTLSIFAQVDDGTNPTVTRSLHLQGINTPDAPLPLFIPDITLTSGDVFQLQGHRYFTNLETQPLSYALSPAPDETQLIPEWIHTNEDTGFINGTALYQEHDSIRLQLTAYANAVSASSTFTLYTRPAPRTAWGLLSNLPGWAYLGIGIVLGSALTGTTAICVKTSRWFKNKQEKRKSQASAPYLLPVAPPASFVYPAVPPPYIQ